MESHVYKDNIFALKNIQKWLENDVFLMWILLSGCPVHPKSVFIASAL
jgi:hypothetical protein